MELISTKLHQNFCNLAFVRFACITLALTLITTAVQADQVSIPNKVISGAKGREIHDYLNGITDWGFHGTVLVAQKGKIILNNAYGLAQTANEIPWTTNTPGAIGSVVKQFTASAIMKLESAGKVSTDDSIGKYFKDVPPDKKSITLHHLLTHSAGLPMLIGGSDFDAISKEDYLEMVLGIELASIPGKTYGYSNVGFSLLAMVVEQVSGMGYEEYLRQEFFDPLGMERTGWRIPKWDKTGVSQSHDSPPGRNSLLDMPQQRWHIEGNGGLYSTTADMYRWYLALQGDDILPQSAKKKMFTRHIAEDPEGRSHYGYGWSVQYTRRGGDVIWHNGGGAAGYFAIYQYINDSAVFIVFTNKSMDGGSTMDHVAVNCSRILFGEDYPSPPKIIHASHKVLDGKSGTYALSDGSTLSVKVTEDALEIRPDGQSAMNALFPSEMAPMLDKYNGKSIALIEALCAGDFTTAAEMFSPGSGVEKALLISEWAELDTLGEFVSAESHGVRMGELAEAYLTAKYTKGDLQFKSFWMMGKCFGFRSEIPTPTKRLLPTSESSFASFSLQSGTTTAHFDKDGALIFSGSKDEMKFNRTTE